MERSIAALIILPKNIPNKVSATVKQTPFHTYTLYQGSKENCMYLLRVNFTSAKIILQKADFYKYSFARALKSFHPIQTERNQKLFFCRVRELWTCTVRRTGNPNLANCH
ncbi:MAG: hypothetical protein MUF77_01575 [Leptospira sp.]|jgi:hypothetical protein|nr:hypothetical protein [Leptospira sp.]